MTETDWSAELAIACAACGAPVKAPCRNDQGHPVEYMHIDRVVDAAEPRGAAATETAQPDPAVVAWMRDFIRRCPFADRAMVNIGAQEACGERTGKGRLTADALAACYEAARKPLTGADIPAGQGAASLYLRRAGNGETELWFKRSDGVPFCMDILDSEDAGTEDFALRDHLAATLPTITGD